MSNKTLSGVLFMAGLATAVGVGVLLNEAGKPNAPPSHRYTAQKEAKFKADGVTDDELREAQLSLYEQETRPKVRQAKKAEGRMTIVMPSNPSSIARLEAAVIEIMCPTGDATCESEWSKDTYVHKRCDSNGVETGVGLSLNTTPDIRSLFAKFTPKIEPLGKIYWDPTSRRGKNIYHQITNDWGMPCDPDNARAWIQR